MKRRASALKSNGLKMCIHVRKERIRRAQLQKEEEEFSSCIKLLVET